ncbi:MAG: CD3072 family TudS-related putative desulfidase [Patescibacteria group bacterium]
MKRSKKVIFASHCLLNQNARASGVAKSSGVVKEFVNFCIKKGYGIVPIECPQLQFEPLLRQPATREHYDNRAVRSVCRNIITSTIKQIIMYRQAGYAVCGIFGVEGSPTCGAVRTHVLSSGGRSVNVRGRGIFYDEMNAALKKRRISVPIYDWDIQAKKALNR